MKVLHVNNTDLDGRGFNGYDLMSGLEQLGVTASMVVTDKKSDSPNVVELNLSGLGRTGRHLLRIGREFTKRTKIRALDEVMLRSRARILASLPQFREADVVHYHLIHNDVISVSDLPWLAGIKPTVWSWHDPWPTTGHCTHPLDCEGWLHGCAPCPHLDWEFPIERDIAGALWERKRTAYARTSAEVLVASPWMERQARKSPLVPESMPIHLVPYGLDPSVYLDPALRRDTRRALGIPDDEFVIMFRSTSNRYKGVGHIIEALSSHPPLRPTTIVTVDSVGLIESLAGEYTLKEYGWLRDRALHYQLLNAADVFLMPSIGETFGVMAIEAMAASRPVITFDGTSLREVTGAPDIGISVPLGDSKALREAIDHLAANPAEATERGMAGREMVLERYTLAKTAAAHEAVYRQAIQRFNKR